MRLRLKHTLTSLQPRLAGGRTHLWFKDSGSPCSTHIPGEHSSYSLLSWLRGANQVLLLPPPAMTAAPEIPEAIKAFSVALRACPGLGEAVSQPFGRLRPLCPRLPACLTAEPRYLDAQSKRRWRTDRSLDSRSLLLFIGPEGGLNALYESGRLLGPSEAEAAALRSQGHGEGFAQFHDGVVHLNEECLIHP